MTKAANENAKSKPDRWVIRYADGSFAGSPLTTRTRRPQFAGCLSGAEASVLADRLGGEAVHVCDVLPNGGVL